MGQAVNTELSYGYMSKFFHWVVFALVLLMLSFSYFMDDIPDKMLKGVIINAHKLLGITVLILMTLRLIWTLANTKPILVFTRRWEYLARRVVHSLLYFTLILMPISGWVMSAAAGRPPRLGNIPLNLPIMKNEWLSNTFFDVHSKLALIIIALVVGHVFAALYHHFIRKDNTLTRMLP
jgi:cytochrome b561